MIRRANQLTHDPRLCVNPKEKQVQGDIESAIVVQTISDTANQQERTKMNLRLLILQACPLQTQEFERQIEAQIMKLIMLMKTTTLIEILNMNSKKLSFYLLVSLANR